MISWPVPQDKLYSTNCLYGVGSLSEFDIVVTVDNC